MMASGLKEAEFIVASTSLNSTQENFNFEW